MSWAQFLLYLNCLLLLRNAMSVAAAAIDVPCPSAANGTTTFLLSSNNTYALTNCFTTSGSGLVFLDMAPLSERSGVTENITIVVNGGNVLPRFSTRSSLWLVAAFRNIRIEVTGVHAGSVTELLSVAPGQLPLTMLDVSNSIPVIQNISISFVDSTLKLAVNVSSGAPARVAPLLLLSPSNQSPGTQIQGIVVSIQNSSIVLDVSISGASTTLTTNAVAMVIVECVPSETSFERFQLTTANSTLTLIIATMELPTGGYSGVATALFLLRVESSFGFVTMQHVMFIASDRSNLTVKLRVPRNSTDLAAILRVGEGMRMLKNLTFIFQNSTIDIENVCASDCSVLQSAQFPRAFAVEVAGIASTPSITNISNVSMIAADCAISIDSPRTVEVFTIQSTVTLQSVVIKITNCTSTLSSSRLNIGGSSRFQTLVGVSSSDNASDIHITLLHVSVVFFLESGDCLIALSTVIAALDNISYSVIYVEDVSVVSKTINGTATSLGGLFAALSMFTSILYMTVQISAFSNTGKNVSVTVTNTLLVVLHATTIPLGPPYVSVGSIASIVNIVRPMSHCNISVADSHVVRSRLEPFMTSSYVIPSGGSSPLGSHFNVTAVVCLFDSTAAVVALNPGFATLILAAMGGMQAPSVHTNVTMQLQRNCTITFQDAAAMDATNTIALLILPATSNQSTFVIEDVAPHWTSVGGGGVIGSLGQQTQLVDTSVTCRRIRGVSMLLLAMFRPLVLVGPNTALVFENVSVYHVDSGLSMQQYVIGTDSAVLGAQQLTTTTTTTTTTSSSGSGGGAVAALIQIVLCDFHGFTMLLMPGVVDIAGGLTAGRNTPSPLTSFLYLGCNLWDGAPLQPQRITTNATLQSFINYPKSPYNSSLVCPGAAVPTVTASLQQHPVVSSSQGTPHEDPPVSSAVRSTNGVVFAALLATTSAAGGGGGAVATLQRSMAAVRLANFCAQQPSAQCSKSTSAESLAPLANSSNTNEPMSSDLSENPLQLPLPVGEDSLQYAAGASVGNALLSCAIGAMLHLIAKLQRRATSGAHQARHSTLFAALASMLPSSLLLGSLAIPYGTLGQPAISACVALVLSVHRTLQSIACGVVMLLLFWLAFPIACAYLVLAGRGRRSSMFVLQSTTVVIVTRSNVNRWLARLRNVHQYFLAERAEWVIHPGCSKRGTPERRYAEFLLENMEAVFGAYVGGREWYFVVEWGVLVVSAAVLGAAEITAIDDAGSACVAAQWGIGTVLGLSAAQVVLCVWLRPFSVRAEFYIAVLLGTLSVVCQALALAGDADASAQVDSVAATLEIVFIVLLMLDGALRTQRCNFWTSKQTDGVVATKNRETTGMRPLRSAVSSNTWRSRPASERESTGVVAPNQLEQLAALVNLVCEGTR